MSGMTATGFEPNNNSNFMEHNHFIAPPMSPSVSNPASFANGHGTNPYPEVPQPNDTEPPAKTNGWTEEQDDLVRRLKHEKKKAAQIKKELEEKFDVERSENAISKRWKTIKKRDSKDESKAVIQNVMPPSLQLQLLTAGLAKAVPEYASAQHDPQGAWLINEVQEDFQKGFAKLVEACVLKVQRVLRHGGANL
ncbi:hypothetical protein N0V85_008380 [Neurospora sp. IMI 360204]|nr:hypothetical protein N0V85_008380 [Neurospora sp. IMI 360204]